MFIDYLKSAFRNLGRNKVFTIINIIGLATGLASAIVIYLMIEYETSFDSYHQDADNIYRVTEFYTHTVGTEKSGGTPYPLARAIRQTFPEIKATYLAHEPEMDLRVKDHVYKQQNLVVVDSSYFDFFDHKWISGNSKTSLLDPHSMVLTRSIAEKYFPDEDPYGKIIRMDGKFDLKVTGIIEDPPSNTNIPCEVIVSTGLYTTGFKEWIDTWYSYMTGMCTFVSLPEGLSADTLVKQLKEQIIAREYHKSVVDRIAYGLQPLDKVHYEADYSNVNNTYTTDFRFIFIFGIIGFVILVIASINYVNLSTAQSLKRSKEIGIRKVAGAQRPQIFSQFMFETLVVTFFALVLAMILAEVFLPVLNEFIGYGASLSIYKSRTVMYFLVLILVLMTLMSGAYPSIYLSGFKPILAIHNKLNGAGSGIFNLRNLLVVIQFFISLVLIICTIIMINQMDYFRDKDLGFDKKNVLVFNIPEVNKQNGELLEREVRSMPEVDDYTFGIGSPTSDRSRRSDFNSIERDDKQSYTVNIKTVDTNYINFFELKLLAGDNVSQPLNDTVFPLVVNEKLIQFFEIDKPEDAIGHRMEAGVFTGFICGVVEDFHSQTLHQPIIPLVMVSEPTGFGRMILKVHQDNKARVVEKMEIFWNKYFPDFAYDYFTLEDSLGSFYDQEEKTKTMVKFFMFLAILIACLGLFGIVSFIVVRKTKEIGIRKVLGASISEIVFIVAKDFLILVLVANILSWPVSWYIMDRWLEQFSFRISIGIWVFIFAAVLSLVIAMLTISYQAMKAALSNPVEAIKCE